MVEIDVISPPSVLVTLARRLVVVVFAVDTRCLTGLILERIAEAVAALIDALRVSCSYLILLGA